MARQPVLAAATATASLVLATPVLLAALSAWSHEGAPMGVILLVMAGLLLAAGLLASRHIARNGA